MKQHNITLSLAISAVLAMAGLLTLHVHAASPETRPAVAGDKIEIGTRVDWTFKAGEEVLLKLPGPDILFTVPPAATQPTTKPVPIVLPDPIPGPSPVVTGPTIKLPGGVQKLRVTITKAGTRYIGSADPNNRTIINGGFKVAAPDCYFENLEFDGDTTKDSCAIKIMDGGSAGGRNIRFDDVYNGIFAETTKAAGGTWINVTSGGGVRKYPIGIFGAQGFTFIDCKIVDYAGAEHCMRVNGQGGVAAKNITVIRGEFATLTGKEPLTIRHGERVKITDSTFKGGYGVRVAWEGGQPDVQSKDITFENCLFNRPFYVFQSGVDGFTFRNNRFVGLTGTAAIQLNPFGNRTRNVLIQGNTRDTNGDMVKNAVGIPNFRMN